MKILILLQLLVLAINTKSMSMEDRRENSRMHSNFHEIPKINKNTLARVLPESSATDMEQLMDKIATDPKNTIPLVNSLLRYF